jgi:hypothetical protein
MSGTYLGQQLLAKLAPGSPELEEDRLLAEVLTQRDRLTVEIVHLDSWCSLPYRSGRFLGKDRPRLQENAKAQGC